MRIAALINMLAAGAALTLAAGASAYRVGDRRAGHQLVVIGGLALVLAGVEHLVLASLGR